MLRMCVLASLSYGMMVSDVVLTPVELHLISFRDVQMYHLPGRNYGNQDAPHAHCGFLGLCHNASGPSFVS